MRAELTLRFTVSEKKIIDESAARNEAWERLSKAGGKGGQRVLPPEQESGSTKVGGTTHKTFALSFQLKPVIYPRAAVTSPAQISTLCTRHKPNTRVCSKDLKPNWTTQMKVKDGRS